MDAPGLRAWPQDLRPTQMDHIRFTLTIPSKLIMIFASILEDRDDLETIWEIPAYVSR